MITREYNTNCHVTRRRWIIFSLIFAALISGCATKVLETKSYRFYEIGKQASAKVGAPMLVCEKGIKKEKTWVGILNSPDGWKISETRDKDKYIRQKLIYGGRSGSAIKVVYREYREGSTIPEQQENLNFELSESNEIKVKNFLLKVLTADEDSIIYTVISD